MQDQCVFMHTGRSDRVGCKQRERRQVGKERDLATPNALFIGWGPVITGRETVSFQVFAEAIQYFAGLQQHGEIESFEPIALEWHGGELTGFLLIRGDGSKLQHLRYSDEFIRIIDRGASVVQDFGVVSGWTGESVQHLFDALQRNTQDLTS